MNSVYEIGALSTSPTQGVFRRTGIWEVGMNGLSQRSATCPERHIDLARAKLLFVGHRVSLTPQHQDAIGVSCEDDPAGPIWLYGDLTTHREEEDGTYAD